MVTTSADNRALRQSPQPALVYQGLRDPEALMLGGQVAGDDHAAGQRVGEIT